MTTGREDSNEAPPRPREPDDEETDEQQDEDGQQAMALADAFRGAFRETWARVVRKEINAVRNAARRKGEEFDAWFEEFSRDHEVFARDCLRELSQGYFLLRDGVAGHYGDYVAREYRKSIMGRVAEWKADPARGYDHDEGELAAYWAERVLGYSGERYEQSTAA
jgi:hypothetical protein